MPAGPRVAETAATDYSGPIHLPDRDLTAVVLKQDVGFVIAVVITDTHDMPPRPGVADAAATDPWFLSPPEISRCFEI